MPNIGPGERRNANNGHKTSLLCRVWRELDNVFYGGMRTELLAAKDGAPAAIRAGGAIQR